MELKDLFQKKRKIVEEQYLDEEQIKKYILQELDKIEESFGDVYDSAEYWDVEVFDEEFTLYYEFGNIDFKDVLQLSQMFRKKGFELYCITDGFTRKNKEKGLFFLFRSIEDDAP